VTSAEEQEVDSHRAKDMYNPNGTYPNCINLHSCAIPEITKM
jgi:hypothetical protein